MAIMSRFDQLKAHLLQEQYTWLVTGVAGFIGSHLLEFLLSHHQKVIGLDNFANGYQHNLDEVLAIFSEAQQKLFKFVKGDIREPMTCRDVVENVDFVLHQAALGSVPRSIKDPLLTHETNATGALNMLIAAKEAKVRRFVFASSSSVYGDSPLLPKVETHQGHPLSPYAVSKMTNELYAKAFSNVYHLETIGLRYFNVFGTRQNPDNPYAAVLPIWIKALLSKQQVYINGDGETSRDFCYVNNVIQANILSAFVDDKAALNQVYNVAVGERAALNQVYEFLQKLLSKEKQAPLHREARVGDIKDSLADINKAKSLLGYQPTHTIWQGLEEIIPWYQRYLL
jgi:UDP-N-acetylglucosamine/UDP-N-acetylgalactosamine 4-epimerase